MYHGILLYLQALSFWYKVISNLLLIKLADLGVIGLFILKSLLQKCDILSALLCLCAWVAQTRLLNLTFMYDCTLFSPTYQVNLLLPGDCSNKMCMLIGSERPSRVFVPGLLQGFCTELLSWHSNSSWISKWDFFL